MLLPALQEDRVQEVSCIFQLWYKSDVYHPQNRFAHRQTNSIRREPRRPYCVSPESDLTPARTLLIVFRAISLGQAGEMITVRISPGAQ